MAIIEDAFAVCVAYPGITATIVVCVLLALLFVRIAVALYPDTNPFLEDTAREPAPLQFDQTLRDKVIKQGFNIKKIPDGLDAIVIGSGMGGLTAANLLARANKKVLVLEQHDQAGGCLHTFIDKGYEFDVGVHYIGKMQYESDDRFLIHQLTEGQLRWSHLDENHDVVHLGSGEEVQQFNHMSSPTTWRAEMIKRFPDEEKAIDKFLTLIMDAKNSMMGLILLKVLPLWIASFLVWSGLIYKVSKYFHFASMSLKEVLEDLTTNADLKAVLSHCFGDYGVSPKDGSFMLHALVVQHYMHGSSYPVGGSSEFAYHMIPVIERAGGKVLVRCPVSQILINEKGKAHGVRVSRSSGDIDIFAPVIISNAGIVNTFKKLLPKATAVKSSIYPLIDTRIKSGIGSISVFIGLKGSKEELGLKAQNIWTFTRNDYDSIMAEFLSRSVDEVAESDIPILFISFPSAKDPTFNDRYPGRSTCVLITLTPFEWFEKWQHERVMKRGESYDTFKTAIAKRMWEQTLQQYPHLRDKVEYFEVGSPLSNQHYLSNPRGELYGLHHDKERIASPDVQMKLRPQTDIPGLFLSGQDILTAGVTGAMSAGVLCACRVLNRNIMDDMQELRKYLCSKHLAAQEEVKKRD